MMRSLATVVVLGTCAECFVGFTRETGTRQLGSAVRHRAMRMSASGDGNNEAGAGAGAFDPFGVASAGSWSSPFDQRSGNSAGTPASAMAALGAAAFLGAPEQAAAKGGEYGILEGRIVSFAHPVAMASCFLVSLAAGYTGLQWRRTREIGVEVSALRKELKAPQAALEKLQAELQAEGADTAPDYNKHKAEMARLQTEIGALQTQIDEKSAVRKELASQNFRDPHWALGSILLGVGVSFAIEGPVNTYMRAGKLFPGPHLYAGAGCTVLWALAASLVPEMQKGKEWARTGHIGANVVSTALFAYYQIPTGIGIAQKVIEKTKFP